MCCVCTVTASLWNAIESALLIIFCLLIIIDLNAFQLSAEDRTEMRAAAGAAVVRERGPRMPSGADTAAQPRASDGMWQFWT